MHEDEKGWISLHRKIQGHWVWQNDKTFKIWVSFLMKANHQDNKFFFDGNLFEVERGSFITSLKKLAKEFGCSISKIRRVLILFENDSMIELKTDTKKTQITICNYDSYQDSRHTKGTQKTHRKNAENTQTKTNNNDNNDNNENKYAEDETALDLVRRTLGITRPAYVSFANELILKYGSDKARSILRYFADNGFNIVSTMRNALNDDGTIKPKEFYYKTKNEKTELSYTELIQLPKDEQVKYSKNTANRWVKNAD